jgi:hypothetical protein
VSLRDKKPLYKHLDDLIQRRNGLVHKEQEPPLREEAYRHVETAVEVFRWLDDL